MKAYATQRLVRLYLKIIGNLFRTVYHLDRRPRSAEVHNTKFKIHYAKLLTLLEKSTKSMSALRKHIIDTFGFSESEYVNIQEFFKPIRVKKGDHFLEQGKYVKKLGFVESGVLREFLYVNDKEVTKWFSTSGYFAVDLTGFLHNQKAKVNFQALSDTSMLAISKRDYDKIGDIIPKWNKLEKMFLTKCFSVLENRVISHLSMNAEERYNQLFEFQPELFNQVPLIYLASMLGMTPETLSRIRNKHSKPTS